MLAMTKMECATESPEQEARSGCALPGSIGDAIRLSRMHSTGRHHMRLFTLAVVIGLGASAPCIAQADLTGSTWLAEDIMGAGVIDRAQSTLQSLPDGRVAGSGGCNRFTGKGVIGGGKVEIGLLATTRMACPPALMDQEAKYLKALASSKRYELAPDGKMRFYNDAGTVTVRFSLMK
jgi:heat shock protein HslJ